MNKTLMDLVPFRHIICGDALLIDDHLRFVGRVERAEIDPLISGTVRLEFTDEVGVFHRYDSHDLVTRLTVGAA